MSAALTEGSSARQYQGYLTAKALYRVPARKSRSICRSWGAFWGEIACWIGPPKRSPHCWPNRVSLTRSPGPPGQSRGSTRLSLGIRCGRLSCIAPGSRRCVVRRP